MTTKATDWRKDSAATDFDPDDEELSKTPQDVIDVLGFDPLDESGEATEASGHSAESRNMVKAAGKSPPQIHESANAKHAHDAVMRGAMLIGVGNWLAEKLTARLEKLEGELESEIRQADPAKNGTERLFANAEKRIKNAYKSVRKDGAAELVKVGEIVGKAHSASLAQHHGASVKPREVKPDEMAVLGLTLGEHFDKQAGDFLIRFKAEIRKGIENEETPDELVRRIKGDVEVKAGDVDGHPFRGNQWTEGGGHFANLTKGAQRVGMPNVIHTEDGPRYQFQNIYLNTKDHPERAQANFVHEFGHHFDRQTRLSKGDEFEEVVKQSKERAKSFEPRQHEEGKSVSWRMMRENEHVLRTALTGEHSLEGHSADYLKHGDNAKSEVFSTAFVAHQNYNPRVMKHFPELHSFMEKHAGDDWKEVKASEHDHSEDSLGMVYAAGPLVLSFKGILDTALNSLSLIMQSAVSSAARDIESGIFDDLDEDVAVMGMQWVCALENTCEQCLIYDGAQWDGDYNPVGDAPPYPGDPPEAMHPSCRCRVVPVDLTEPAVVPRKVDDYFRSQKPAVLAAVFGKAPARGFLEGELSGKDLLGAGFKLSPDAFARLQGQME